MANTPNQPPQGNQPQQGQPQGQPQGQQPQQAHHAALTAAGVPQEHAATLAQNGVTPDQYRQLAGVSGFNIQSLLQLIQVLGPAFQQAWPLILALFGKQT